MLTGFNREIGTKQGRIKPSSVVPFSGDYVFCLGYDDPGRSEDVTPGDFALVEQHAKLAPGTRLLRVKAAVRPPKSVPAGHKWVFELLWDDKVAHAIDLVTGGRTRNRSFAINVASADQSKQHFVTARLRFIPVGTAQFVSLASFEFGPPEDQAVGEAIGVTVGGLTTAFGTANVYKIFLQVVPVASIASTESVSSAVRLGRSLLASGISSGQALGSTTLRNRQLANPSGVATAYATGSAKLNKKTAPTGIASGYASGSNLIRTRQLVNPVTAIPTGFAAGTTGIYKLPPSVRGTANISAATATTSVNLSHLTSGIPASGWYHFIFFACKVSQANISTPSGYTRVASINGSLGSNGVDAGQVGLVCFVKQLTAADNNTTVTVSWTGNVAIYRDWYVKNHGGGLLDILHAEAANTVATTEPSFTFTGLFDIKPGDTLMTCVVLNSDNNALVPLGVTGASVYQYFNDSTTSIQAGAFAFNGNFAVNYPDLTTDPTDAAFGYAYYDNLMSSVGNDIALIAACRVVQPLLGVAATVDAVLKLKLAGQAASENGGAAICLRLRCQ